MQIAILGFSIIGAATGTASLLIMLKTAKELKAAKDTVDTKVSEVEGKVTRNAQVVRDALGKLEF